VVDLGSVHGTFVRTEEMPSFEQIEPFVAVRLGDGDSIRLGLSERRLVVDLGASSGGVISGVSGGGTKSRARQEEEAKGEGEFSRFVRGKEEDHSRQHGGATDWRGNVIRRVRDLNSEEEGGGSRDGGEEGRARNDWRGKIERGEAVPASGGDGGYETKRGYVYGSGARDELKREREDERPQQQQQRPRQAANADDQPANADDQPASSESAMSRGEVHWNAVAGTLGNEKDADKFLRLLGAKKNKDKEKDEMAAAASATSASAAAASASSGAVALEQARVVARGLERLNQQAAGRGERNRNGGRAGLGR
jgi:hypothetical protein